MQDCGEFEPGGKNQYELKVEPSGEMFSNDTLQTLTDRNSKGESTEFHFCSLTRQRSLPKDQLKAQRKKNSLRGSRTRWIEWARRAPDM
eukprot:763159-Hanusia_phi.AAC.14